MGESDSRDHDLGFDADPEDESAALNISLERTPRVGLLMDGSGQADDLIADFDFERVIADRSPCPYGSLAKMRH